MKKSFLIISILSTLLITVSCSDFLDEQPRSTMTPEFFSTPDGIEAGLTSAYSQLRWIYGPHPFLYMANVGTDEATWGDGADFYGQDLDKYNVTSGNEGCEVLWDNTFPAINTCNGIVSKGVEAGVDDSFIGEAKFLRGINYFLLVTTFGDVPLDLGSGKLEFNIDPKRMSKRDPVEDVYTQAIIPDLEDAVAKLPFDPRITSAANKVAAEHFLAKAYLAYAWWLERSGKSDPAGKTSTEYFQLAYDTALEAIQNPGSFSLQATYRDVNDANNDYNSEILFCADHTPSSYIYDESTQNSWGTNVSNNMKSNRSSFAMTMDFELQVNNNKFIYRQAVQDVGRPWRLLCPPHEVFTKTFSLADREIDSRFAGTFTTVFRANYQGRSNYDGQVLSGMNNIAIQDGDTVFYFPPTDMDMDELLQQEDGKFGYYSDRAYGVWTPSMISRHNFPSLWKFGPKRDNAIPDGPLKNDASTRPFPIAKLSETYLIAAEAAVKGAQVQAEYNARELINVLRRRAGQPNHGNEMVASTPQVIDIDYILMERSRELFGEALRWYDLVRTGKLEEYAASYTVCEAYTFNEVTITREIKQTNLLRPIPASQFDNMDNTDEEKNNYQNPGY